MLYCITCQSYTFTCCYSIISYERILSSNSFRFYACADACDPFDAALNCSVVYQPQLLLMCMYTDKWQYIRVHNMHVHVLVLSSTACTNAKRGYMNSVMFDWCKGDTQLAIRCAAKCVWTNMWTCIV
jgi:hypothetical protein